VKPEVWHPLAVQLRRSLTIPMMVTHLPPADTPGVRLLSPNRSFYGDKIYQDAELLKYMARTCNSEILTPVKGVKGQPETTNQWGKAANDLYSRAVSRVRQPIESLFNWLIDKTDIQRASKVRSTKGLLVHVFGKIAAALIYLIFNS